MAVRMYGFLVFYGFVQVLLLAYRVRALDCKGSKDIIIASPEDVAALNACTNITARVSISASAPANIHIRGPKALSALHVTAATSLRSLSSPSLLSIDTITLDTLPNLSALNFSTLKTLDKLGLSHLPALENCTFGLGPRREASVFNTSLQRVDWLKWPVSTSLNISSNPNLVEVSLPWDSVQGAVSIAANPALEKVDVFAITDVPGVVKLADNDALVGVAFEQLKSVKGVVDISGGIHNVSMPALTEISGSVMIASTEDIHEICEDLKSQGIRGRLECKTRGREADATSAAPGPSQSHESLGGPSGNVSPKEEETGDLAIGAKIGIGCASVLLGLFFVVGAVFFFRARSRGKVKEIVISAPIPISTVSGAVSLKASPKLESAEALAVGTRGKDVGGVKLALNGEEMKEVEGEGGEHASAVDRGPSVRSVSSMGTVSSQASLVRQVSPL